VSRQQIETVQRLGCPVLSRQVSSGAALGAALGAAILAQKTLPIKKKRFNSIVRTSVVAQEDEGIRTGLRRQRGTRVPREDRQQPVGSRPQQPGRPLQQQRKTVIKNTSLS
jgi:hypothetical protein